MFQTKVVRWTTVLLATVLAAAGVLAVTGPTATAQRVAAPQLTCQRHGSVVFMQYYSWAKPPASNGCWTIIKPRVAPDNSSYVDCDMSGSTPSVTGAGPNWIYDDTNVNGHNGSSDQTLNNAHCGGRTSWWGEYMAASGGFVERWSPTFLFEENYTSTHAWVPYTLSVNYTGSTRRSVRSRPSTRPPPRCLATSPPNARTRRTTRATTGSASTTEPRSVQPRWIPSMRR